MSCNIWHVLPVADIKDHIGITVEDKDGEIESPCECKPRIEVLENGAIIVVHNSFDGREGVEWANSILNKKHKGL